MSFAEQCHSMKPKNVVLDRLPSIDLLGNLIFIFGIYIQVSKLTNLMHDTLTLVLDKDDSGCTHFQPVPILDSIHN